MKNKLGFISGVAIVLIFLSVSGVAQESSSVDDLIKNAREQQSVKGENYLTAVRENKPQEEQNRLQNEYLKAVGEVEGLLKAKAALTTTQLASPKPSPIVSPSPVVSPSPARLRSADSESEADTADSNEADDVTIDDCTNRQGLFSKRICDLAKNIIQAGKEEGTLKLRRDGNEDNLTLTIYGQLINKNNVSVNDAIRNFVLDAEQKRTDKQVGSDSNSKGTTSLVVKGGIPSFLNFAAENGAAVRSINGTTVTFRFNPIGIYQVLNDYSSTSVLTDHRSESSGFSKYLRKMSVGLSFDASRGQETPVLVGNERQLSAFSLRYEFFNDRNPRKAKWRQKWSNFFLDNNGKLVQDVTRAEKFIFDDDLNFKNRELGKWFDDLNEVLGKLPASSSVAAVEQVIMGQFELMPKSLLNDKDLIKAFDTISNLFIEYNKKRQELLDEIAKAPVMTFEYTNNREPDLPDTHNFNFIFAKGFALGGGNVMDATFNASLTFFNKKPTAPDVKRIRDFSFAGQLDFPLFSGKGTTADDVLYGTVFSIAGKYQRLTGEVTALDGTVIPNLKGDIWVGQAKLNIPFNFSFFKNKGVSFPISVTFANRTELVRESRVSGNFGFTFDIDKVILSNILPGFR